MIRFNAFISQRIHSNCRPLQAGIANKKFLQVIGVSTIGYAIWWYYYPHNPFSPEVSKLLRAGLWEEEKGKDYRKSLKFYGTALHKCLSENMNPVSKEYTGIEIKTAEMYEKLGLKMEANLIYFSILEKYSNELKINIDPDTRGELIKKELSIAIKILNNDTEMSSQLKCKFLNYHINVAQDEIFNKSPEIEELIFGKKKKIQTLVDYNSIIKESGKYSKAFEPFKEEFICARDILTELELSNNDIENALDDKMITVGWMILANMSEGQILLSQANLGSMLYLKFEKLDGEIYLLRNKSIKDTLLIERLERSKEFLLDMATKYYENVIANAGKSERYLFIGQRMDTNILQAIALSIYGLGIINIYQGKIMKASELLNEASGMAKEIGFHEVRDLANEELQKLGYKAQ